MKKIVSLLAVVSILIGIFSGITVLADTPKELVNGDAELGTTEGFFKLFGHGSITNEEDPKDKTNRVIHYVPTENQVYSTLLYDVGPAIVQDDANGYNGGGAGKYYLKFKILGDTAGAGDMYFRPSLVAENWSGFSVGAVGSPNKYVIIKSGAWTEYTIEFNITDNDIAKLTKVADYVIGTRIDGSNKCAYEQGNYIGYYIDDIVFYKEGNEPTPKPTAAPTAVPTKELINGDAELGTTEGFLKLFGHGSITNEADPKDNTNRVIHYVPAENQVHSTLLYDVGPAIVQDDANGYNGGGAGKYYLKFKILGDTAGVGDMYFRPSLVAENWSGFSVGAVGNPNTYVIIKSGAWTEYTIEFNVTDNDIAKLTKVADYVIGTRIDGSSGCAYANENYIGYYIDDIVFYKEGNEPTPKPTVAPTMPPAKEVVNGDAELGTEENWGSLFGNTGDVKNVVVDDSNVIHFTPIEQNTYSSVFFDLGPAIIKDDSMKETAEWYAGYGVGTYTLSFRIKADTVGATGKFSLGIESGAWRNNIVVTDGSTVVVTDEWTTVVASFTVTQDFLDTLKNKYSTDNSAYQLGIRLDGSNADGAYKLGNYFGYYIDDVTIAPVKFAGAMTVVENSLAIKYMIEKSVYNGNWHLVEFTMNGKTVIANRERETVVIDGVEYVEFIFDDISAKCVSDTITATIKKAGVVIDSKDYSIKEYCLNILRKTDDAELKTLLVDLLNYGTYTQIYTGNVANGLANATLTDDEKALGTDIASVSLVPVTTTKFAVVNDPIAVWKSASVFLTDKIECQFTFTADSISNLTVGVKLGDGEEVFINQISTRADGRRYITFDQLNVVDMRKDIYVTVYSNGDAVSNTLRYSIESYASAMMNVEENSLGSLVKALIAYGDSANNYIN